MAAPTAQEQKAKQHEVWEVYASGYSEVVIDGHITSQVHEVFVNYLVPLLKDHPAPRILDIAAASGEPSLSLAAALPQASFTSTDLAESYLSLGRARAGRAGVADRVTFEAADGEDLSHYPDASFDAVTCSLGLMFFPDERKGLSEFYRVLKPGGVLAVTVWGASVPVFQLATEVARKVAPPPPPGAAPMTLNIAMRFGDGKGLCGTISDVGFADVAGEKKDVAFSLPSGGKGGREWWDRLLKTPFPLKQVVARAKDAGNEDAEEMARKLLEEAYRDAGYFSEDDNKLVAKGNDCHFITARKPSE